MNDLARISLTNAAVRSGFATMEKAASASPQQQEILAAAWPNPDEEISKSARLSRIIATGIMIDEAEQSVAEQAEVKTEEKAA